MRRSDRPLLFISPSLLYREDCCLRLSKERSSPRMRFLFKNQLFSGKVRSAHRLCKSYRSCALQLGRLCSNRWTHLSVCDQRIHCSTASQSITVRRTRTLRERVCYGVSERTRLITFKRTVLEPRKAWATRNLILFRISCSKKNSTPIRSVHWYAPLKARLAKVRSILTHFKGALWVRARCGGQL